MSIKKNSSITAMTKNDCDDFNKSKKTINGTDYYANPFTNEDQNIASTSKKFQKIDQHCKSLDNKEYIKELVTQWLKHPTRDPQTKLKIPVSMRQSSAYAKLYYMAYQYFKDLNLQPLEIKDKLPNKHLLFNGQIDLLYYEESADTKHKTYYEFITNIIDANPDTPFEQYHKLVLNELGYNFTDCIFQYLKFTFYIKYTKFEYFGNYVSELATIIQNLKFINDFVTDLNIYSLFHKSIQKNKDINADIANRLLDEFDQSSIVGKDLIIYYITSAENMIVKLNEYFDEIYKIYNYKQDPENSPFENIENKQFTVIEDPLLTILKKIGIDNIELETLELPDRPFTDDNQYQKYSTRYDKLKSKYKKNIETWRETLETIPEGQPSPPRPKQPMMKLPNDQLLNVATQFMPHYVKDEEYSKIVKTYDENKSSLTLYKKLIDEGILDLIEKVEIKDSKPLSIKHFKTHIQKSMRKWLKRPDKAYDDIPLLQKDKNFFKTNVLNGNTEYSCKEKMDVFDQSEFEKDDYPLAKLQLMFQLRTSYENKARVDCFYAPNFYNHIVNKINSKSPLTNPVTNAILSDEEANKAIEDVMKIMNVLDPNIEKPYFLLPAYDKKYIIKFNTETRIYSSGERNNYYKIYTERTFGDREFKICELCYIPADFEIQDTGSTDMTSATLLQKIFDLFNNGSLMTRYVPPYYIEYDDGYIEYVKLGIHFNNYATINHWERLSYENKVRKFIHIFEEIRTFI